MANYRLIDFCFYKKMFRVKLSIDIRVLEKGFFLNSKAKKMCSIDGNINYFSF